MPVPPVKRRLTTHQVVMDHEVAVKTPGDHTGLRSSIVPWVHRAGKSLYALAGPDALRLDTDIALRGENLRTVADFTITEGEGTAFVLIHFLSYREEP